MFMDETKFKTISYIGLRKLDGSYLLNVPLYVNITDICIGSVDEIMHRVTEIMNRHYEQQISNFFKTKGEIKNEI
jgi:hypothetical protein